MTEREVEKLIEAARGNRHGHRDSVMILICYRHGLRASELVTLSPMPPPGRLILAIRLGRSLQDLVGFLSELHALKVDLFLHQQGLDTTTPAGKAMFQMMGVFAEFERAMIQERVRAGLARARSEGKRLGRPPIAPELEERIRKVLATPGRPGVRKIAMRFGVDPGTVQRISRPPSAAAAPAAAA